MRQGLFEVKLIGEDGQSLPEHMLQDATVAAVVPGTRYEVQVTVHRDGQGEYPSAYLTGDLQIDGASVGYSMKMNTNSSSPNSISYSFRGFRKCNTDIAAFIFAFPADDGEHAQGTASNQLGTVKFIVYAAQKTEELENSHYIGKLPEQQRIGEDKKFWKQASVTTVAGKPMAPLQFSGYRQTRIGAPLATLELRYHTEETVQFLQDFHAASANRLQLIGKPITNGELVDLTEDDHDAAPPAGHGSSTGGTVTAAGAGIRSGEDGRKPAVAAPPQPPVLRGKRRRDVPAAEPAPEVKLEEGAPPSRAARTNAKKGKGKAKGKEAPVADT